VYPPSPNGPAHSAPKHRMHLPPGSPDPPEGVVALDRLEAVHQHLLRSGEAVDASLDVSPSTCQAVRTTSVRAPTSCRASVRRSLQRCSPRSSVATLARLAPRRPFPRQRPTILDYGNPVIAQLSLSILSVGHTNTVDGCPSSASARQRQLIAITFDPLSRKCTGLAGFGRDPHDVAVAESIPADPAKQEARVPSERS
jgi:hypothetical protein